jgi:hypothetical protein
MDIQALEIEEEQSWQDLTVDVLERSGERLEMDGSKQEQRV